MFLTKKQVGQLEAACLATEGIYSVMRTDNWQVETWLPSELKLTHSADGELISVQVLGTDITMVPQQEETVFLFMGLEHFPKGGVSDFQGSFPSLEEALETAMEMSGDFDWAQVTDANLALLAELRRADEAAPMRRVV